MYDGSAIAAAEIRFREDLWRTAPSDAVEEAAVEYQRFGPLLATAFGELPHISLLNMVMGAAEPEAISRGYLAEAVEWLRTWEVDYRVSVTAERPETEEAERWLKARGYEPGGTVRRYVHAAERVREELGAVSIRSLRPIETEGMSHIFADALGLPKLATVLMIGLPKWEGWSCYAAYVEGREVGCGSMRVCGNVALLGLDATLPDFRERGCQSALITRRVAEATRKGCQTVAAEVWNGHPASAAAAEVLEHAGFEEIPGRTNWRRPSGIA